MQFQFGGILRFGQFQLCFGRPKPGFFDLAPYDLVAREQFVLTGEPSCV